MKNAVITGASGGIGSAIAKELSSDFRLALICNENKSSADALCTELTNGGADAEVFTCDLSNQSEIADCTEKIKPFLPHIDLIVNAAGIAKSGLITEFTARDFDKIFAVNVRSMFLLNNAFLPDMIRNHSGNIINIASIWGETGGSCEVLYSASKAAVIGYTKALASELGPSGIRVNCISPGFIDTKMTACYSNADKSSFACDTPLSRIGTPSDVAAAAAFLASEKSSFITGEVVRVNGGYLM